MTIPSDQTWRACLERTAQSLAGDVEMYVLPGSSVYCTYDADGNEEHLLDGFTGTCNGATRANPNLLKDLCAGVSLYQIPQADEYDCKALEETIIRNWVSNFTFDVAPHVAKFPYKINASDTDVWTPSLGIPSGYVRICKSTNIETQTTQFYVVVRACLEAASQEYVRHVQSTQMTYNNIIDDDQFEALQLANELNRDRIAAAIMTQLKLPFTGRRVVNLVKTCGESQGRVATPVCSNVYNTLSFARSGDGRCIVYRGTTSTTGATTGLLLSSGPYTLRWMHGDERTRTTEGGGPFKMPDFFDSFPTTTGSVPVNELSEALKNTTLDQRKAARSMFKWDGPRDCIIPAACPHAYKACSTTFLRTLCNKGYDSMWGATILQTLVGWLGNVDTANIPPQMLCYMVNPLDPN